MEFNENKFKQMNHGDTENARNGIYRKTKLGK